MAPPINGVAARYRAPIRISLRVSSDCDKIKLLDRLIYIQMQSGMQGPQNSWNSQLTQIIHL